MRKFNSDVLKETADEPIFSFILLLLSTETRLTIARPFLWYVENCLGWKTIGLSSLQPFGLKGKLPRRDKRQLYSVIIG